MNVSDPIEMSQQFIDTYFGGNSKLFDSMDIIDQAATDGRLNNRAYQEFVLNRWLIYLASFEDFPTLIERFWWSVAFENAGMSFTDAVMRPYLKVMVTKYWEQFKNGFEESKKWGAIPSNIKTAEEYLALIFAPYEARPYTNDPIYQVLGVKTGKELEALSFAEVTFKQAKMVVDGTFVKLHNAAFHDAQRAFDNNDAKDECKIDQEKLERLRADSINPKKKRKYSIDARLEDSGIVHRGYGYKDGQGDIVYDAADNSIDTDQDADEADIRISLIDQLKSRELDLFYAELERRKAKKTREQWYGPDKALKVTQQMKYLKRKYSSD